jgi:pimeloyl-ACP methyl ester carboxylesterase
MKAKSSIVVPALLALVMAGSAGASAQSTSETALRATPPKAVPTFSTVSLGRQGFYYAGGEYVEAPASMGERAGEPIMRGAMYVDVWVPTEIRQPYPIVFFHGNGQTATNWMQTPDGRPGWAYYLLAQGYVLYMVDYPTRGRSTYVPGHDGNIGIRTAEQLEEIWTNVGERSDYYLKDNHTQWPGTGKMGDPVFDTFVKSQVEFAQTATSLARDAAIELLDTIGTPVILLTHSQGGNVGMEVAEARPKLVRAIVTSEPGGGVHRLNLTYEPAIASPGDLVTYTEAEGERPGEEPCVLQRDPVRRLVNFQMPILNISGNGGYHRTGDACPPKFMNQAGANVEFVRLEDVGMNGNGHMMMMELNSDQIVAYIDNWLREHTLEGAPNPSVAMPPAAIPTFSTEHLGSKAFYYAGGEYVEAQAAFHGERAGHKIMRGAMYMDVWVPKQIRQRYPIVLFHGNGQTGVDWQQTPDGRPGWAYYLIEQGYVVYMVDYPARGRSAYVPGYDGNIGIRTAHQLEEIWTNVAERGDFPLKNSHTQWPGTGKVGDPVFDTFNKTQVHFAGASTGLAREAAAALLDTLGTPVILLTHSQGGGVGWDVAERRPDLVHRIVTVEPGGPQIGGANTATVEPGNRNPNSWGLTTTPFRFDPPITSPSELNVRLEETSDREGEVRCWMQVEPARKLANFQDIRVLAISGNGTYHRVYDPCIPKWLNQAGVQTDFVRLEDEGMSGNGHMMMLERNSDDIVRFIHNWIQENQE